MESDQVEKIYVAIGNDLQDGYKTLDWVLDKWRNSHQISIVILHVAYNISKDFVYTPFGKLPASSVSEEKLEVIKMYEQEKTDKLLSEYINYCGKVKAETLKVEMYDEPIHKLIVDLISGLRITKLVMDITFMKSSSWRSKSALGGSFYVHQKKPDFCDLFIICGGKLVLLRGEINNESIKDDYHDHAGIIVAKMKEKGNFKCWLGKFFFENQSANPSENSSSAGPVSDWDRYVQEIENYLQQLLSSNLDEDEETAFEKERLENDSTKIELNIPETANVAKKIEYLESRIDEAYQKIHTNKEDAKASAERRSKAEWTIRLCNNRVAELEIRINKEVVKRTIIQKNLNAQRQEIYKAMRDVEQSKHQLISQRQLQSEVLNKLKLSSSAIAHAEDKLEETAIARVEMIKQIEDLRRQRDIFFRRIEFCREKDALGTVPKPNELICNYREYMAEDIKLATDNFSEHMRLKSSGDWTNVYRGRIDNATVAIKIINSVHDVSQHDFLAKVELLHKIRHPHLVAVMGFCTEPKSIVFEYMHNGNLREILLASQTSSRKRNRVLKWHERIQIAHEVSLGLTTLHSAKPKPIAHGQLTASDILLDRNLVAKITGLRFSPNHEEIDVRLDIRAFGVLLMHLLTGRNWIGLVEEAMMINRTVLVKVLDEVGGNWPLDLVEEVAGLAMRCLSVFSRPNTEFMMAGVTEELDRIKKKGEEILGRGECEGSNRIVEREDSSDVPSVFLCPIFQDIMKNPMVAADGFSYEEEAIEEWLRMGHDTSPMTNLRLNHKLLTPNQTLRSLIQEWLCKSPPLPC